MPSNPLACLITVLVSTKPRYESRVDSGSINQDCYSTSPLISIWSCAGEQALTQDNSSISIHAWQGRVEVFEVGTVPQSARNGRANAKIDHNNVHLIEVASYPELPSHLRQIETSTIQPRFEIGLAAYQSLITTLCYILRFSKFGNGCVTVQNQA